jgi:hypothetical protein
LQSRQPIEPEEHRQVSDLIIQIRSQQRNRTCTGHQQASRGGGVQVQEDDEGQAFECQAEEEEKEVRNIEFTNYLIIFMRLLF